MRRLFVLLLCACALSSCGLLSSAPASSGPLYYWGGSQNGTTVYEDLTYRDYKTQTPEALCRLVCAYQNMVDRPSGSRQLPPPGVCAEYGFLLLQPSTAAAFMEHATASQRKVFGSSDYGSLFSELGQKMLEREMELYPESAVFIKPLIKKLAR